MSDADAWMLIHIFVAILALPVVLFICGFFRWA